MFGYLGMSRYWQLFPLMMEEIMLCFSERDYNFGRSILIICVICSVSNGIMLFHIFFGALGAC